jgi:outer membrane protein TolC
MRVTRLLLFAILVQMPLISKAQSEGAVLGFAAYMEQVRRHHPVAFQADLQPMFGSAAVQAARGNFDPKLYTVVGQKQLNGTEYYSMVDAGVKAPTWFGIELNAGYQQNRGAYLNPELNTPGAGLWSAGLSLPVGQGLLIDRRRAELRKAQIYEQMTGVDRQIMINDLMLEAGTAYWEWARSYAVQQVYEDAGENAQQRLRIVRRLAELGDRPFVDTLEASIFVQTIEMLRQQAALDLDNARLMLGIYLWEDGITALQPSVGAVPEDMPTDGGLPMDQRMVALLDTLVTSHPELRLARFKLDQLNIERRFRADLLKPLVNLKYNAINEPVDLNPVADFTLRNYTWGLDFAFPLLLRKERGQLKMAKLAIREAQFGLSGKMAVLDFKARAAINTWATTLEQSALFGRTVRDYRSLLDAEQRLFEAGESSIFMVNARQNSYISAQNKFLELLTKNRDPSLSARIQDSTSRTAILKMRLAWGSKSIHSAIMVGAHSFRSRSVSTKKGV